MRHKWLLFLIMPISAPADELFVSNVTNGCSAGLNADTYLVANFVPNQHQCGAGYYLPANSDGCAACPAYYDCNGGTFTFNAKHDQGNTFRTHVTGNIASGCQTGFLGAANNFSNIIATFTPNVHNCNAGYYLPANTDECTKCLNDNYCPGGTYTFNETMPQGIVSCPSAHPFAPSGMQQETQCGRVLHFGDEVLYLHQSPANPAPHRLFARIGDVVYSANAVLRDANAGTFPKMSYGATRGLHVMITDIVDGQELDREYLIHDDSVE